MDTFKVDIRLPYEKKALPRDITRGDEYNFASTEYGHLFFPKAILSKYGYLKDYLSFFPEEIYGFPLYVTELSNNFRHMKTPNLIYILKNSLFIHVLNDLSKKEHFYIPIEPYLVTGMDLIGIIEEKLSGVTRKFNNMTDENERKNSIISALAEFIYVVQDEGELQFLDYNELSSENISIWSDLFLFEKKSKKENSSISGKKILISKDDRIILRNNEYFAIESYIIQKWSDLGYLMPFLEDPYVDCIYSDKFGNLILDHKIFRKVKSNIKFKDYKEFDDYVIKLSSRMKSPIKYKNPVTYYVKSGTLISIGFRPEPKQNGSHLKIQIDNEPPISILDMIKEKELDFTMAAFLWIMIEHGVSIFIAGDSGSGKSTFVNSLVAFIPHEKRVITVENTPELVIPHKNWTKKIAHSKGIGDDHDEIFEESAMHDLLKNAISENPEVVIQGEIHGIEIKILIDAIALGVQVITTIHASSIADFIERMFSKPSNNGIKERFKSGLVLFKSCFKREKLKDLRKITGCFGLFRKNDGDFSYVEIFSWNSESERFNHIDFANSPLLKNIFSEKFDVDAGKNISEEIEKRAEILKKLQKAGNNNFWDFFHMISKIEKRY